MKTETSLRAISIAQCNSTSIDFDRLPDSTLLSDAQAAAFLTVAVGTLSVWRSTGRHNLPYRKIGRNVRYRLGDLRDWLDRRQRCHTGQGG